MGTIRNVAQAPGCSPGTEQSGRLSRRRFLTTSVPSAVAGAALATIGAPFVSRKLYRENWKERVTGDIKGAAAVRGHLIKSPNAPHYGGARDGGVFGVVIIGGGVSGLSAAWELSRKGFTDYRLLELHSEVGGNALGGVMNGLPHPWGAHYLPVPNKESEIVRELLSDLGEIQEELAPGAPPRFKEESLVSAPEERLFHHGRWRQGIVPSFGVPPSASEEYSRFFDLMRSYQVAVGHDGRPAFAIPAELSSSDSEYTRLDAISFAFFLSERGFRTPSLLWYIDYCCRDDYGATPQQISAWAGIHYFASRRGWGENAESDELLTWPNGNAHLVAGLARFSAETTISNSVVLDIRRSKTSRAGRAFSILFFDTRTQELVSLSAGAVILATPLLTHRYVLRDDSVNYLAKVHGDVAHSLLHNPWIVANLLLSAPPDGLGTRTAWDNVIYGSESLGYISATHQDLKIREDKTVLTYYLPKVNHGETSARTALARIGWEEWRDDIVKDLSVPHRSITEYLEHLDVWVWGHGMAAPPPGFIWGRSTQEGGRMREAATKEPGILVAHSDCGGISLFEQAQWWGVHAARSAREFIS